MVQTGKHPQTNGRTHTHGRFYRYCYAVDKEVQRNLRYNKIHFMCSSVFSNRPQFPSDLHQKIGMLLRLISGWSWDDSLRDRV